MVNVTALVDELNQQFNGQLKLSEDGQAISTTKDKIQDLLRVLKEKHDFKMLIDITAVDYEGTFEVIYHIMRFTNAEMLRLKVTIPAEKPNIGTITGIWKAADVMEREIFDLMGIVFEGHNNLKRILCRDDFKGHPLRKDFKLDVPGRF